MYEQTLRPYRVRQTQTEVTAIEWDMRRDPLSPEVLTQLFTHGATEEVNVGFDCVERIVLAADEIDAKSFKSDRVKISSIVNGFLKDRESKMNEIAQLRTRLSDLTNAYNEQLKRQSL